MGAIGSLVAVIFGIGWTLNVAATPFGVRNPMVIFGVAFVVMAVIQFFYHFKNTAGKNRMSLYDITDDNETAVKKTVNRERQASGSGTRGYCPHCGHKLNRGDAFCSTCGQSVK
jgi:hypothetical protein